MTYENTMTMEAEGIYKKYDSKLQNCVMAETVEALKKSAAAADGLFRVSTTVKKGALPVAYMRLGDLLISAGVIRPEQLNDALAIQTCSSITASLQSSSSLRRCKCSLAWTLWI